MAIKDSTGDVAQMIRMIEAVRSNPDVDGYCIHALCAGDWILGAGLIDLWRNPKSYAYEATRAANQPRIVSIRLSQSVPGSRRGPPRTVFFILALVRRPCVCYLQDASKNLGKPY